MSKSHSDYMRDQEVLPLHKDKRDDYRVLHGFVTDAIDSAVHSSGALEYDEVCALAERAFDLGRKVARAEADKGPRPYHRSPRLEEILLDPDNKPLDFVAVVREGEEPQWAMQRHVDALTNLDTQQSDNHGDAAAQRDVKGEPCPHDCMDDDGCPPRRDWDDFPKVGLVDFSAITRSVSGG